MTVPRSSIVNAAGRLLVALAAAATCAGGERAFAQQPPLAGEVQVVASPVGSGPEDTTYEIHSGSCRIRWTVTRSGVNQGIAQHRASCPLPLVEQISLNSKILDKVLSSEPTFRMLFLGRLTPFPDLSARLAAAAKRSNDWDAIRGRPKPPKTMDRYLLEVVSTAEPGVFAEWKQLFENKRLRFAVSGVEAVSVAAADTLPYFQGLAAQGVKATDRVPFDCLVWFSASRQE